MDRLLFSAEENAIAAAEATLAQSAPDAPLREPYAELLQRYRQLHRQSMRLVKMGDRMQSKLNELNASLTASEHKYRNIFENVAQGIYRSTASGELLDANPAMARILGYKSVQECLEHARDIAQLHYQDPGQRELFLEALTRKKQVRDYALRLKKVNGEEIWVEIAARGVFDKAGRLQEIEGVAADCTERRRMLQELRDLARLDGLTGLFNRRHFMELSQRELVAAKREGWPVSLVFFDADHFKRINDAYGHDAGDAVLKELAQRSLARIRQSDILARLGGEEFAVLLPRTDLDGGRRLAENIRLAFEESPLRFGDLEIPFTASFGLAQAHFNSVGDGLCVDTLIKRADQALYHAKQKGRNRVATHGEQAVE
jgi:diguanylate cyclase (GGDEF)-like protein/PAS domain S-box-containing protein